MRVIYTDEALRDLDDILTFLAAITLRLFRVGKADQLFRRFVPALAAAH